MIIVGSSHRQTGRLGRWAGVVAGISALMMSGLGNAVVAHADPLIYPGMEIVQSQPDSEQLRCTLGFVDPDARIGVTAGHCGGNGPVFTNDGTRIGRLAIARSNIQPEGPLARGDYRVDYEGIVFDDGVPINNLLPNGLRLSADSDIVPRDGLTVCRVGITTGEACGTVSGIGNGWFLVNGLPVDHGDSGSPVYAITSPGNAAIVGIVSARFKAVGSGDEATVALSWPSVVKQMRDDIAKAQPKPEQSDRAQPNRALPDRPPSPPMVLAPAPTDDPPSGSPKTIAT